MSGAQGEVNFENGLRFFETRKRFKLTEFADSSVPSNFTQTVSVAYREMRGNKLNRNPRGHIKVHKGGGEVFRRGTIGSQGAVSVEETRILHSIVFFMTSSSSLFWKEVRNLH